MLTTNTAATQIPFALKVAATLIALTPLFSLITYQLSLATALLALASASVAYFSKENLSVRRDLAVLWIFWLYVATSSFWAVDAQRTFIASAFVFSYFVVASVFSRKIETQTLEKITTFAIYGFLAISALCAAIVIARYGTLRPGGNRTGENDIGAFGTRIASFMAASIPMIIYIGRTKNANHGRALFILAWTIGILSGGRSGILSLFLASTVGMILVSPNSRSTLLRMIIFVTPTIAVIGLVMWALYSIGISQDAIDRISSTDILSYFTADSSDFTKGSEDWGRLAMYATGWPLVWNPTILGIGFQSLGSLVLQGYGRYVQSHNLTITIVGELGLAGLALFSLVAYQVWQSWKRVRQCVLPQSSLDIFSRALMVTIGVVLIVGQFRPQFDNPLLFMSVGAIWSLARSVSVRGDVLQPDATRVSINEANLRAVDSGRAPAE